MTTRLSGNVANYDNGGSNDGKSVFIETDVMYGEGDSGEVELFDFHSLGSDL